MRQGRRYERLTALAGCVVLWILPGNACAQGCTVLDTGNAQRAPVTAAAMSVATALQTGDAGALTGLVGGALAANFGATAGLAAELKPHIAGDALTPTFAYLLVQNAGGAGPAAAGDFVCTSPASTAEVTFSLAHLDAGRYAFVLVDAVGSAGHWRLAMLLQSDAAGAWKLIGLYPHTAVAAGEDGVHYWRAARAAAKAGNAWVGWLDYGLADELLRPANFVSSGNLDMLRSERQTAAPPALSDGLSAATPLALKTADGQTLLVTSLALQPDAGGALQLRMVLRVATLPDANAERARNLAAARALLLAHPELRGSFGGTIRVVAETEGQTPFETTVQAAELN